MRAKRLLPVVSVPVVLVASVVSAHDPVTIAPPVEPEDTHARPAEYQQMGAHEPGQLPDFAPLPMFAPAEYPLAITFDPADPSNHSVGGMISYDYVVVHTMQGYYAGAISWFKNPASDVSAHFCMNSEDGEVTQMVKLADKAWHVGSSNPYAIGIEHEGFVDEPAWYTWATYSSSALLARWIADELGIPLDRNHIVGHVELPNQTHTDPGIHWNWDLYMALIQDVVPQGWVEGYVVDRGAACTLTTTSDTWIKTTLQQSSELDDTQKCFVAAGTEIEYLHASGEMMGHYRLSYDALGGPCEGFIDLDSEGFVFADHVTATCSNESKAAVGAMVSIDGGTPKAVNPDGYFSFPDVGPGPHTIDVIGGGEYADTIVPVDVDVYPGARLIIGVDPLGGGDGDGDTGETGGSDEGECPIGAEGCACTPGGGCDPGLLCSAGFCVPETSEGGEAGDDTASGGDNADEVGEGLQDDGIDYLEADSCSVSDEGRGPGALLGLALLGLSFSQRRRLLNGGLGRRRR